MQSMFATALLVLALSVAGGAVAAGSAGSGPQHLAASPYVKVRVAAARALAAQAGNESLDRLRGLAADRAVAVRLAATHGLARRGAFADVARSLADPAPEVRRMARRLLADRPPVY